MEYSVSNDAAKEVSRAETMAHIDKVRHFINMIADKLVSRGIDHDASKLEEQELSVFAEWGPRMKEIAYGSDEYKDALVKMGVALEHHYINNSHHPENHSAGVSGMDLVDLVEMVCDWKASSLRVKDGDFLKSLEIQKKRFDLSPQLVAIIANTAVLFEEE